MRPGLALLFVAALATSAHAGVLDLTHGMSVAQVKATGVCHKAVVDRALMTCRATAYAGRIMGFEILIPDDRLHRVILTANLGTTRKGAEKILADVFTTLEQDFTPLVFTDGAPATPAAVFSAFDPRSVVAPVFWSDPEAEHGRFVTAKVVRSERGFFLELTLVHKTKQ